MVPLTRSSNENTPAFAEAFSLVGETGLAGFALFRCGVLGVNSCARPRFTTLATFVSYAAKSQNQTAFHHIKRPAYTGLFIWSGRQDLNLRPRGPKPRALPDCATPRLILREQR